jgi:ABC-type uncharacterized transport system substrate-binding protein
MGYSTDPVGNGFVTSLSHPGGNITGLTGSSDDTAPKQMELLATIVPNISRVGVLVNPSNPGASPVLKSAQAAAQTVRIAVIPAEARSAAELETAFAALAKNRAEAIMVASDAFFNTHRKWIIELAFRHRLSSIFPQREYAEDGGLMSYGESLKEFFRRAASFVDKIIKGANPGNLPVEQPTLFKLVVNRKTADALGIAIPPQVYLFADEVIE